MSALEQRLTISEDTGERIKITLSDARRQILASCLSFTLVIQVGISLSYSSVLLPQLDDVDSDLKVSSDEASWIASLFTLMIPVGSVLAGPLMDRYGRKTLSALSGLPFAAGWLTMALATTPAHLYIARILTGMSSGFSTVCLVYCSELTHPVYRPMLLGLNSVFVSFGILVTCSLGVNISWRSQAFAYCALSLLTVVVHWPLPESPHWLPSRIEAEAALKWIYTRPEAYRSQVKDLLNERERRSQTVTSSFVQSCLEPIVYKPMFILTLIFLFQQLSGAYVVIFYSLSIFRELKVQYEEILLIMFGAIRFVMAVVSLFLSRIIGRRPLLFISGIGMCLSCFLAFLIRHINVDASGVAVCVLVFVCFGALGFLGIPWTLIGELFPVKVKGAMGGFMVMVAYVFMFAVVKLYPLAVDSCDIKYMFLIFSFHSLIALLIVYRWLPETFKISFSEIEKYFR